MAQVNSSQTFISIGPRSRLAKQISQCPGKPVRTAVRGGRHLGTVTAVEQACLQHRRLIFLLLLQQKEMRPGSVVQNRRRCHQGFRDLGIEKYRKFWKRKVDLFCQRRALSRSFGIFWPPIAMEWPTFCPNLRPYHCKLWNKLNFHFLNKIVTPGMPCIQFQLLARTLYTHLLTEVKSRTLQSTPWGGPQLFLHQNNFSNIFFVEPVGSLSSGNEFPENTETVEPNGHGHSHNSVKTNKVSFFMLAFGICPLLCDVPLESRTLVVWHGFRGGGEAQHLHSSQ